MRCLIQRVQRASVKIDSTSHSSIGPGLLVLVGFEESDSSDDLDWMSSKLMQLRIFKDELGLMNRSLLDLNAELMLVSQFTLFASTKKGNRPSFIRAAKPGKASRLYDDFVIRCEKILQKKVAQGVFGADMQLDLLNDGPVTIFMDSRNRE